jgi:hypothetical protein
MVIKLAKAQTTWLQLPEFPIQWSQVGPENIHFCSSQAMPTLLAQGLHLENLCKRCLWDEYVIE